MAGKTDMSRALIISWYRYQPHYDGFSGYRVLWEHWLKLAPIWAKEIDKFYLIDQEFNFTSKDKKLLEEIFTSVEIIPSQVSGHHWAQFKAIIPQIKEDNMLFLDNDVVINKAGVIDGWFKALETYQGDFLGSFDNSGGLQDEIRLHYPIMKSLGNRMGSYYFILTKKLLEKIPDYSFEPNYFELGTVIPELNNYVTKEGDWQDSFGLFTLKMLYHHVQLLTIPDPRESIYFQDDNSILKDPKEARNLGYYHIRNGNLANYVLTSFAAGKRSDYQREIKSVRRELLRSLAWFDYMDGKTDRKFASAINQLLMDLKVRNQDWSDYMDEFVKYHAL